MKHRRAFWIVTGMIMMIAGIFFTEISTYGGEKKMESLYDLKRTKTNEPYIYNMGSEIYNLFPVQRDNAQFIATNGLNNAINIITFKGDNLKFDEFFRDAYRSVDASPTNIPPISQDVIGFGQTRSFMLFDFRKKNFKEFRICNSLQETIEKIAIADAQQRHFIFEIEKFPKDSDGTGWDSITLLRLIDLSGKEAKLIKEINIGKVTTWAAALDKIFLYNLKTKEMQALTPSLEPSHHTIPDVIRQNKGKISFTRIAPHPSLPFVILYRGEEGSTYISWGEGRDNTYHPLFSGADQFSFSPDGKWVTFKMEDYSNDTLKTYLMPISEKYPNFLGSPILLLNDSFIDSATAWTTNPISFVGAISDKIYRWELTNEAHPESNKPTFHDYIVERDLEKLTKEKKQGQGKEK